MTRGVLHDRIRRRLRVGDNSQYFRLTPWYNDPVSDPTARR